MFARGIGSAIGMVLATALAAPAGRAGAASVSPRPTTAKAPTFTVYTAGKTPGFTLGKSPFAIVAGPDGNIWFTEDTGSGGTPGLAKLTAAGRVVEYASGTSQTSRPTAIVAGADGNVWFTDTLKAAIGRITPTGKITDFTKGLSGGDIPAGLTRARDGSLWFVSMGPGPYVGRVDTSGQITEVAHLDASLSADPSIAQDVRGDFWITTSDGTNEILVKVTPHGLAIRRRLALQPGVNPCCVYETPQNFAAAPDGSLWFTNLFYSSPQNGNHPFGRIAGDAVSLVASPVNYAGSITLARGNELWFAGQDPFYANPTTGRARQGVVYSLPRALSPLAITSSPDGNVWMTAQDGGTGIIIKAVP